MGRAVDEAVRDGDEQLGSLHVVGDGEGLLGEGVMAAVAQVTRDAAAVGSPVGAVAVVYDSFRLCLSVLEAGTAGAESGSETPLDFERLDRPVHAGG